MVDLFDVNMVDRHEKYLGLSTFVGCNRGVCFSYIKERLWKKLQGWKGKYLSAAGKELLVKVVAQAILLYSVYCYLLPKYFYDELHQIMASFWWNEMGMKSEYIICLGINSAGQNRMVVLGSEISIPLTLVSLPSKVGELSRTPLLLLQGSLK